MMTTNRREFLTCGGFSSNWANIAYTGSPCLTSSPPGCRCTSSGRRRLPAYGLKLAQNIDLAPTVADIVGFEGDFDGVSLFDHSYPARDWVYIEHHASGRNPAFVQAQGRRYVYTWHSTGEQEWYDLRSDPFQRRNAFYEGTLPLSLVESARDFVNDNLARLAFPPGMTSGPPSSTTIP